MSKHTEAIREALAAGPTPGPWDSFYKHKYDEWHVSVPMAQGNMKWAMFDDGCRTERPEEDAKYIAACNPANVAALLAERDALLEALRAIVKSLSEQDDEGLIEHAQQMVNARAAIAEATGEQA